MIAIIDYGAGNLHSVKNALDFLGAKAVVTKDETVIHQAEKVILPGVGAFGDAMENLIKSGLRDAAYEAATSGKPFLGICLGEQLLFEGSEENPEAEGLGVLKGKIVRIPKKEGLKIPHIGWNSLQVAKENRLFAGIGENPFVYFVHSYYLEPKDVSDVSAYTDYGQPLAIAVERGNLFATQFHPEKSGRTGLKILRNFIQL